MNSPFRPTGRPTLSRMDSSRRRSPACGHSDASLEPALRAPHAPYESEYRSAFAELPAKFRRTTLDGGASKRLRMTTSDSQDSAVKAASADLNPIGKTASPGVYQTYVSDRIWSNRVADLNCAIAIQRMLSYVECLRQKVPQYEIRAQLQLESSANHPRSRRTRAATSRPTQHTIVIHRMVEPSNLPSAVVERPRLSGSGSHEIPTQTLN